MLSLRFSDHTMDVDALFSLRGKTALVTGGSRGIGRMIAEGYLRAGVTVYISARKAEACHQTASELSGLGRCVSLPADVSTDRRPRRARPTRCGSAKTELHILVNNAGTTWAASYEDYPVDGFRKVLDLNLSAVFFVTRDLTPLLERAGQPG